ncbi:MAG: hypothetical protein ACXABY_06100 [Candidatus Thorarchaeota archaeon]|jgi:hypothetical protein
MPKKKHIWYCVDDCGPDRKKCRHHYGISLECIGLIDYIENQRIFYRGDCPAYGEMRRMNLMKEPKYAEQE